MFIIQLLILVLVLSTLAMLGLKIWNNPHASIQLKKIYLVFFGLLGLAMIFMLLIWPLLR